ncbi:MAG: hypothetical protein ACOCWZ_10080 [Spirochaetota bacterium]
MKAAKRINKILEKIDADRVNRTGDIYLNRVKETFITFDDIVTIPRIPVKELPLDMAAGIMEDISGIIPEFMRNHVLLEKRQPPSEVHSIHLVQRIQGKILDFYHIFRIHLQFGGDTSAIVRQGTSDLYPSFITNRVYYTSRLVPGKKEGDSGTTVDSFKLKDRLKTESDQHFHTFAIFDDVETGSLTRQLLAGVPDDIFQVSTALYPFVVFDYFTACMNILYPTQAAIEQAADIFEPLFFVVAGGFVPPGTLAPGDDLSEVFSGRVEMAEDQVRATPGFTDQLREYFSGLRVERDDELAVKGWWRFVFEG